MGNTRGCIQLMEERGKLRLESGEDQVVGRKGL